MRLGDRENIPHMYSEEEKSVSKLNPN